MMALVCGECKDDVPNPHYILSVVAKTKDKDILAIINDHVALCKKHGDLLVPYGVFWPDEIRAMNPEGKLIRPNVLYALQIEVGERSGHGSYRPVQVGGESTVGVGVLYLDPGKTLMKVPKSALGAMTGRDQNGNVNPQFLHARIAGAGKLIVLEQIISEELCPIPYINSSRLSSS